MQTTATIVLIGATGVTVWTLFRIPSWQGSLADPCLSAAIAAAGTVVLLWLTRWLGPRGTQAERILLAVFLAAMPLVYVARCLWATQAGTAGPWLGVELLGVPLFAALASLGWKRSPWFLAAGIAAHGLGWDAWHYQHSAYIPDWYATGCLLVDLALGAYVAVRIPAWRTRS